MAAENDGGFRCIKITLMVLYILSLIGTVVLVIISIAGLSQLPKANSEKEREINEVAKTLFTVALVIGLLAALVSAMGLYGVIKENKCIMITMTVLCILAVVSYAVQGAIVAALWALAQAILTGVYAKKIIDKQRMDFDNKA